jgi:hypothetical protein
MKSALERLQELDVLSPVEVRAMAQGNLRREGRPSPCAEAVGVDEEKALILASSSGEVSFSTISGVPPDPDREIAGIVKESLAKHPSCTAAGLAHRTALTALAVQRALERGLTQGWSEGTVLDPRSTVWHRR